MPRHNAKPATATDTEILDDLVDLARRIRADGIKRANKYRQGPTEGYREALELVALCNTIINRVAAARIVPANRTGLRTAREGD